MVERETIEFISMERIGPLDRHTPAGRADVWRPTPTPPGSKPGGAVLGSVITRARAAAALALSGRYAFGGRQAAQGLQAWAHHTGVRLTIVDATSDPARTARCVGTLAPRHDLLFGPYASGPMRAVQRLLAGEPWIVWNHGAAAARPSRLRQVDVLAPAARYWSGLPDVLIGRGVDLGRVALLVAQTPFSRQVARGAVDALARHAARPLWVGEIDSRTAGSAADRARTLGAQAIVGCGRLEDDIALGNALRGVPVVVALVACGVAAAERYLGNAIEGWIGPSQWPPDGARPPFPLPRDADYPAAQAAAAGMVAAAALEAAGTSAPDALWDAARSLCMDTHLGPFAVDANGQQIGTSPSLVTWSSGAAGWGRQTVWRPRGS